MSGTPDDRLLRVLGGDHLAALRKRLRRRFERAAPDRASADFRVGQLTPDEHAALASLIGRPPGFTGSLRIDLAGVDATLRQAGIAPSLRDALEQLDGPILHLATERDSLRVRWAGVVAGCRHPDLIGFLQAPAAMGLLKRLSHGDPVVAADLCYRVDAVLRSLPAHGLTRAQLAADVLGDAHALDGGRAVATFVLAVWRQIAAPMKVEPMNVGPEQMLAESQGEAGIPTDFLAETARDVWARAGVLVNELARPAMFLNLPAGDSATRGQIPGEPGYVSLRRLVRSPPSWCVTGRTVYVCENPNLLAIAADRLGSRCAPMVCTDGMPAAAQNRLLAQLTQAGARLRYHGDFDWAGLRIGNYMMREYGACPWRFGAADYAAAVRVAPRPGHRLEGAEVLALWDAELTAAMRTHRITIAEEGVSASLLQDLDGQETFINPL